MLETRALPEDVAKTSQPQTWHEPRGERIHGKKVKNLRVCAHSKPTASAFVSGSAPQDVRSTLFNHVRGESVH